MLDIKGSADYLSRSTGSFSNFSMLFAGNANNFYWPLQWLNKLFNRIERIWFIEWHFFRTFCLNQRRHYNSHRKWNNWNFNIFIDTEPAPFSFKIGWGLTPQSTTSPSSFLHQSSITTTAASTSTENLSSITPTNHGRHSTEIRDPAETCESFFYFLSFFRFCFRMITEYLWFSRFRFFVQIVMGST